jgi:hypothetical protein
MAGGIIYLDVDDEITSVAARIRGAETGRVAVVLPNGSRVATSRINFRLLARDAQTNGKRLSIVAGDAATRALAASAGLPIFGTVGEYESTLEVGAAVDAADAEAAQLLVAASAAGADDAGPSEGTLVSDTVATPRPGSGGAAVAAAAAVAATRPAVRAPAAVPAARVVADTPDTPERPDPRSTPGGTVATGRPRPVSRTWRSSIGRTPLVIGLAILALALVVGGVGAFLYLPTATAVVTPRTETIGPRSLRIRADTSATEPDLVNAVVPAQRITIDLEATDTFPATGRRVEETQARGAVRFENLNPTGPNTIPKGSVVSTNGGVRFRTDTGVTIAAAELVGLTIVPTRATVKVTAVDAGPEGNVEPNAILTVPRDEEPLFLKVRNLDATTGGKREEFPRVIQEDVDAAVTELTTRLATSFEGRLEDPDLPGDTGTVFPETKVLGAPTFAPDPTSFVGQETETFELAATSQGTVVAVDTAPVQLVAEATIVSSVDDGFELVDGSGQVVDSPAEVSGGVITFPVTVTASQVLLLDTEKIKAEIMGKPLADARAILAGYGVADLQVWPEWVGTIPTLDTRVVVLTSEASP